MRNSHLNVSSRRRWRGWRKRRWKRGGGGGGSSAEIIRLCKKRFSSRTNERKVFAGGAAKVTHTHTHSQIDTCVRVCECVCGVAAPEGRLRVAVKPSLALSEGHDPTR